MRILTACVALLLSVTASAQQYTLVAEHSGVYFMTTKARNITEVHSFKEVSGTIKEGQAEVRVLLSSWDTNVAIRDERMTKHLLADDVALTASAALAVKPDWLALKVGESSSYETTVRFSALGVQFERPLVVRVSALAGDELQVNSITPVLLSTATLAINDGVATLQKLAGLSDISESVPVSFDLRFSKENK